MAACMQALEEELTRNMAVLEARKAVMDECHTQVARLTTCLVLASVYMTLARVIGNTAII